MAAAIPSGVPKAPIGVTRFKQLDVGPLGKVERSGDRRVDGPRTDAVHPQAGSGVLHGQRPGEGEHPTFGRGVGRGPRLALVGGRGGQVHDVPAPGQEVGERLSAHEEGAGQVDGEQPVPLVEGLLVGVGKREHAGHVDHDVEGAQPVDRLGHQPLDAVLGADVADQGGHGAKEATRLVGQFGQQFGVDVDGHDRRPFCGQPDGRGPSDARCSAGHEGGPTTESFWSHGQTVGPRLRGPRGLAFPRARSRSR